MDAIGSPGGRVAVQGTVIANGRDVRICHLVLESYPPQCGRGLTVEGLDLSTLPEARSAGGVTFADARLVGELVGGTLRVTAPPEAPREPEDDDRPTRDLGEREQSELALRYEREILPLLEEDDDEWLEAHLDERGGYIRVLVIDGRGALARRLGSAHGDVVDVEGWVTHL